MLPEETVTPNNHNQQSSDGVKVAENQAIRFLGFIFQGLTQGYVEFRYFSSGQRPKMVEKPLFIPLPFDSKITGQILTDNYERMILVGPTPRYGIPKGGKAAKDHDVIQASCIWADLNYGCIEGGAIGVGRILREFPLRPSVTVNYGYGRHVYFALNKPLSDGRLLDWDELIRGLRDALGGTETVNISRTFLLPGSQNLENPQNILLCRIDDEDSSWMRYSVEELKEATEKACVLKQARALNSPMGRDSLVTSQAPLLERGVPQDVLTAIVTGRPPSSSEASFIENHDYHARDIWIASSLLDCGFEKEEIKTVFRSYPQGCGRKWAREKHGERYLELTVRTAQALRRRQGIDDDNFDAGLAYFELPPEYELDIDHSIWYRPAVQDSQRRPLRPVKISNTYIGIAEIKENVDTGQISLSIEYEYLGGMRRRNILRSQMADARQLISSLAGEGGPVTSNNARHVTSYLAAYEHAFGALIPRKKITSCFGRGRRGRSFFLPGVESDVEFAPISEGDASLFRAYASRRGTLQGWVGITRRLVEEGLMIPQVAILACFVPPLQRRLKIPNFILDINGSTSTGKSTSLKLAASVYGNTSDPDSLLMQWTNTKVAVEQLASTCSELPIFLDDAQHCPGELKRSVVYMIANGRGKGRAARGGGVGEVMTWHTVALSTSEEPLHESSPHEGARGRILSVGGATHPFPSGSASLVNLLERTAALNHGHAGETYIRHLNQWTDTDWAQRHSRYLEIYADLLRNSQSNLVNRVSGYIAAIQLAAETACPLLGLAFKPEAVGAWLMLHLTEGQSRQNLVLMALRVLADFYVANINHFAGDGPYNREKPVTIYGVVRSHYYIGFLRSTIELAFRPYKWNLTALLNKMAEAGVIHATEEDRHTKKVMVEGVKHRMVCVKLSALLPGERDSV